MPFGEQDEREHRSSETQATLNLIGHIFNDVLDLIVEHINNHPEKRLTADFLSEYSKLREQYMKEWDI